MDNENLLFEDSAKAVLTEIRKEFGEQSMFLLGREEKFNIEVRSSGSLQLDIAIGGGYPRGRIIEFRGAEASGKTTLFNLAVAEAQISEPDKLNIIIDLEHAYNPGWASVCGVDTSKLMISQPDTYAEKIYDFIESLLKTGKFAYICVDSISGMLGKSAFEESDWEKEAKVGGISKLNSLAMRKLINSGLLKKSGTTLIFINQLIDKIGGFSLYGTPTTTTGGRSLKHNYSQVIEVAKGEQFRKGQGESLKVLGQEIKIKCSKNKIFPPYGSATLNLFFETGVDRITELVNVAKAVGVLQGTSWLKLIDPSTGEVITDSEGELKWHGKDKIIEAIEQNITNKGTLYDTIFNLVDKVIRS